MVSVRFIDPQNPFPFKKIPPFVLRVKNQCFGSFREGTAPDMVDLDNQRSGERFKVEPQFSH